MEIKETQSEQIESTSTLPPKITRENINPLAGSRKGLILQWVRTILYTMVSSLLVAIGAYCLISPNDFTIGGISGIAILLNQLLSVEQSILVFCLNAPLLVLAFIFIKKKFAYLSACNVLMQTLWFTLLEHIFPKADTAMAFIQPAERIFAAIAGGLCIGVAIVLAFKVGGSTGGGDILAVLIQKKMKATSIAWVLFVINCMVIGASFFVFYDKDVSPIYNMLPIMLAIFESYIESKTNESMTNGFQSAIEFRIITDKPEEMANAVMKELSRGVTSLPAKGMYTKIEHSMLVCVVSRRQTATLKRVMHSVDPDAFAVMSNVSQVLGLGFYTSEE